MSVVRTHFKDFSGFRHEAPEAHGWIHDNCAMRLCNIYQKPEFGERSGLTALKIGSVRVDDEHEAPAINRSQALEECPDNRLDCGRGQLNGPIGAYRTGVRETEQDFKKFGG